MYVKQDVKIEVGTRHQVTTDVQYQCELQITKQRFSKEVGKHLFLTLELFADFQIINGLQNYRGRILGYFFGKSCCPTSWGRIRGCCPLSPAKGRGPLWYPFKIYGMCSVESHAGMEFASHLIEAKQVPQQDR